MTQAIRWRKSSYSGGGDGNTRVEIADLDTRIGVRDSKAPYRSTLTFTAAAFVPFVHSLKETRS